MPWSATPLPSRGPGDSGTGFRWWSTRWSTRTWKTSNGKLRERGRSWGRRGYDWWRLQPDVQRWCRNGRYFQNIIEEKTNTEIDLSLFSEESLEQENHGDFVIEKVRMPTLSGSFDTSVSKICLTLIWQNDAGVDLPTKEDVFGKASALTMKYQEENERIVQQLEENKVGRSPIIFYF